MLLNDARLGLSTGEGEVSKTGEIPYSESFLDVIWIWFGFLRESLTKWLRLASNW